MALHSFARRQVVSGFVTGWALVFLAIALPALTAQGPAATPVRYTEARTHKMRRAITLPGTVEPETATIVASTVAGVVTDFPAKEGMRVEKGDVLAQLDTKPTALQLAAQRAALREAEARLKLAESNLARAKELFAATVIARQQLDDAQSEYNAWLGRADTLKGEIARIEDRLERCTVRAPLSGVVTRERTEVGQWLTEGGPVVELLSMDTVEIRVDVPEKYFPALRRGAPATATFEALPGVRAEGRIWALIPQADPAARTFPVKVRAPNSRGRIGAGMLAQVTFPAGEEYLATIIPKDAVLRQGPTQVVYRVNGDNTVEAVIVETGAGAGAWIEVRGNLQAGDKVVTRGNERLRPGQAVLPTPQQYETP